MYKIKIESDFSAAHNLRGYKGKCETLHGHNWKVEAEVCSEGINKTGMVIDFKVFKEKLNKVLEKLDHKYLNTALYFKKVNPTSENIAKFIFGKLKEQGVGVSSVTVWESEGSCATYLE